MLLLEQNDGELAEAILAASLCAKCIHGGDKVGYREVESVLSAFAAEPSSTKQIFFGKKASSNTKNTVTVTIKIASESHKRLIKKSTWKTVRYLFDGALQYVNSNFLTKNFEYLRDTVFEHVLDIVADGTKGRGAAGKVEADRADIRVFLDGSPTRLNVSLKINNVPRFGQKGGADFDTQVEFWSKFGIAIPEKHRKPFEKLMGKKNVAEATMLIYKEAHAQLKRALENPQHEQIVTKLADGIQHYAEGKDKEITVINISRREAKQLDYSATLFALGMQQWVVDLVPAGSTQRLIIGSGDPAYYFIQFRVYEGRPGYPYNYIEKGPLFDELLSGDFYG